MNRRIWLIAGLAAVTLLCGLPLAAVLSTPRSANACAPTAASGTPAAVGSGRLRPVGQWGTDEVTNAAIIVAVGKDRGVPARGWVIAVATAMQESSLVNLPSGDRDSLGLFQQRPSQGWGTPAQIMDPRYATTKFYDKLLTIPGWQTLPLTEAAQAVQRSAFPTAYVTWEADAEQVVATVAGVASISDLPGASLIDCGAPVAVGSGGWTQPLHADIVSGFRTAERPTHQGVDFAAARNTVIRAAGAGIVGFSGCDADTGNCDIDGSPQTQGCGWFVDINHAGQIGTRYCHMVRRPDAQVGQHVAAGDPIGTVGTSGNSSGPHLHFEVHTSISCDTPTRCSLTSANATDPVPIMAKLGAPIT